MTFTKLPRAFFEQSLSSAWKSVALAQPDQVAIRTPDGQETFGELEQKSLSIARLLHSLSDDRQRPVAIMTRRYSTLIASILGILEARRFYVTIDPDYPLDRIQFMLRDSTAEVILGDESVSPHPAIDGSLKVAYVDKLSTTSDTPIELPPSSPADLAFLIYTSGTTGRPKGIMQTHRNILHHARFIINGSETTRDDRSTFLFSPSFAGSNINLFSNLLGGASIHPFPIRERSLLDLARWIEQEGLTIYGSTPTLFRALMRALPPDWRFRTVRVVRLGGESAMVKDLDLFKRRFPDHAQLFVAYSSSETNGITVEGSPGMVTTRSGALSVGVPVEDKEVSLIDEHGNTISEGVGEITVRSKFVTPGYWGAERSGDPDEPRTVRTGDLGEFLPDGRLVHLGRRDSQVKVRGNRIELSEIEVAIGSHHSVSEAVVTVRRDASGDPFLVAWVSGESLTARDLRDHLENRIPAWMIPEKIVVLDSLPVQPTGKIDRSKLANAEFPVEEDQRAVRKPVDATERQLLEIWQEVLERPASRFDEDFFESGGNSLRAVRMFSEIELRFGQAPPVSSILEANTVEKLAAVIREEKAVTVKDPGGRPLRAVYPLRRGDERHPIFFFSGKGGDLVFLRDLVRSLGPDQPFYGVRGLGLDGGPLPPDSYSEIGQILAEEVRRCQPEGPYVLAGHSSGGALALEVARQLRESGAEVPLVVAVDSHGWPVDRHPISRAMTQAIDLMRRPTRIPAYWKTIVWNFRRRSSERPPVSPTESPSKMHDQVMKIYEKAFGRYEPPPYDGDVTLVVASDGVFRHAVRGYLGWEHVVRGRLEIVTLPGDHQTVMSDAAPQIARLLTDIVARCED